MMLGEPPNSPYDLNFEFLGYRVRVAWGFWILSAVLGWSWANSLNLAAPVVGMDSPGAPVLLLIWIGAVFLSILVHELGHSFAMSYYGTNSRIVLFHFGGLAIPDFGAWNAGRARQVGPPEQIVISAAGPIAQLALAALIAGIGYALGIRISLLGFVISPGEYPGSAAVYGLFDAIIYPSVFWALLNLAPILPMDGGQIAKNALLMSNVRNPIQASYIVSIATGAIVGLYFMQTGNVFCAIMFFMFAANNWQAMQYGSGGY